MDMTRDVQNLSLMLSEVMDDIGLNERTVKERRKLALQHETIMNVTSRLHGKLRTMRLFGSYSEGTTTFGLRSDKDFLLCDHSFSVILKMADWQPGVDNLLMIHDDTVAPGYCLLQVLRYTVPLPSIEIKDEYVSSQRRTRKSFVGSHKLAYQQERHGPSLVIKTPRNNYDIVYAFPCISLPWSVKHGLDLRKRGKWPTDNIKNRITRSVCYVVAVGYKKGSVTEGLEWQISTSEAERCLMFSLNITQIQTYVLMKMLLKCIINCYVSDENAVSSYMCKTVMLHCIANSKIEQWTSNNLLTCLHSSLSELRSCILQENCPHFIIHTNNLMAGKFTYEAQRQLLDNVDKILSNLVQDGVLAIDIDDVGQRLLCKYNRIFVKNVYLDDYIRRLTIDIEIARKNFSH